MRNSRYGQKRGRSVRSLLGVLGAALIILGLGQWMKASGYIIEWQALKFTLLASLLLFITRDRWLPALKAKLGRKR